MNCVLFASPADTNAINKKRLRTVIISESAAAGGSLLLLNQLWYKDYPRSSFHFFNDNSEWMQMDKIGHITTSLSIGSLCYKTLKWAGVENKKAIWYGGFSGSAYLLAIEIFDGLSSQWGFSPGDFTANTLGSAIFISQQLVWSEQRIKIKWSYHNSQFPQYRPDLLGRNFQESALKDYNAQTYWLSGNISAFLKQDSRFPKWLNIAFGYGAEGMVGANQNPDNIPFFERYRQYYLSADIDVKRIKTNSKILKTLFYVVDFLKFPAPAIEYSRVGKYKMHWLYF